jgi:hypothetical protein
MQRLNVKVSSDSFFNEIKKGIRRLHISKVIKACLRMYLHDPEFKNRVDEYIRTNKRLVI